MLADEDDEIAGFPVGGFVGFVFVDDARAFGHAFFDVEGVGAGFLYDSTPPADGADVFDCLPLPVTFIALHLYLLEYPWREHMFLHHRSPSPTPGTGFHHPVCGAAAFAFFADLLLLDAEFVLLACVEISEGDGDADFHVGAATLARGVPEVPAAAEEAGEEVERVVPAATAAALLVLLEAFVAVLVVDAAGFGGGEGVVGFGYLHEFLGGGLVAAGYRERMFSFGFRV